MDRELMLKKWSEFVSRLNKYGIPLPVVRDPMNGKGSVALTLVFISFNLCVAAVIGKWSGYLGGVEFREAYELFLACASLYWLRKFQKDEKGNITLENSDKNLEQKKDSQ